MTSRRTFLLGSVTLAGAGAVAALLGPSALADTKYEVTHTDAEWLKILGPDAFEIMRREGTEPPGSSPLDAEERKGAYVCAGCALPLYSSATKFHSGTGWPSFWQPLPNAVIEKRHLGGHGSHRDPLPALRRSPGPRLQRRTATDRPALLHGWSGAKILAGLAGQPGWPT